MKTLIAITLFFMSTFVYANQCNPISTWINNTEDVKLCVHTVMNGGGKNALTKHPNCIKTDKKVSANRKDLRSMDGTVLQNCLRIYGGGSVNTTSQIYNMYDSLKKQL